MKVTATQAILECLLEQGVDTIFGYPGGTILNIYDELYRYHGKIRHILTAHEQGAAHAADGYARATGKTGVCFATSGPGSTNLTTGIATAYLDSSPVVFITCNVGENLLGKDSFQEVDITGIAMPITKATFLVRDAKKIPDTIRQAFFIAESGRPGPVLIDFLKNVTNPDQMIDYEPMAANIRKPRGAAQEAHSGAAGACSQADVQTAAQPQPGAQAVSEDGSRADSKAGAIAASQDSSLADTQAASQDGALTSPQPAAQLGSHPSTYTAPNINERDVEILIEMIAESERPFIICGGGVVRGRAHKEFREFAEKLDAPVAITLMGGGGFPGDHPLTSGMIGMHGSMASNTACSKCDLLIAVGCRFSDRVALNPATFASQAKIVQIDIDRAEIDKNVLTDHHIVGSAAKVLSMLNSKLPKYSHEEWKKEILPLREPQTVGDPGVLNHRQILETIRTMAPADTIFSTDVGQHQMWAIKYLHFKYPGQLLTSGGFGTMGFGLGAAMGAAIGCPGKTVIHITGDGSFRMNLNELATVEHYGLKIITVIFDNGTLGMVRQWQNLIYGRRFSETDLDRGPDFVKLADAFGLNGYLVTNRGEMEEALTAALASDRASVLDCRLDIDELVTPMVAAGHNITDFLLAEKDEGV